MTLYEVLKAGGIGQGGLNFDAKLRRQSIDPDDLVWATTAMDLWARSLLVAEQMLNDGALQRHVQARYQSWDKPRSQAILRGECSLETLAREVEAERLAPRPRSSQRERMENLANSYI